MSIPEPILFRLDVTSATTVNAVIEFADTGSNLAEASPARAVEALDGEEEWLVDASLPAAESLAEDPFEAAIDATRARAATLWGRARAFIDDYRSPAKRRARELVASALELKQSTAITALELKETTVANAMELKEATVANALDFKEATVANAMELKEATAASALELEQTTQAKVAATTDHVTRGLADVTNRLASRTQRLAEHPTTQKAARGLGVLSSTGASMLSKVRQAEVVRTVSSGAESVASTVREFASIQKF